MLTGAGEQRHDRVPEAFPVGEGGRGGRAVAAAAEPAAGFRSGKRRPAAAAQPGEAGASEPHR